MYLAAYNPNFQVEFNLKPLSTWNQLERLYYLRWDVWQSKQFQKRLSPKIFPGAENFKLIQEFSSWIQVEFYLFHVGEAFMKRHLNFDVFHSRQISVAHHNPNQEESNPCQHQFVHPPKIFNLKSFSTWSFFQLEICFNLKT